MERTRRHRRIDRRPFCEFQCEFKMCKSGKQHKTYSRALCAMDDASHLLVIRLGPKTSECEKNVTVVSAVTGCDVTNCATTLHGFNKHASSRREAVSVSRGVPRCTEKISKKNLRLLICVDRSIRRHDIARVRISLDCGHRQQFPKYQILNEQESRLNVFHLAIRPLFRCRSACCAAVCSRVYQE